MDAITLALPEGFDFDRLTQALQAAFGVAEERRRVATLEVFDTFDWRLHARGRLLVREGGVLKVLEAASGQEVARAAAPSRRRPRFWWDLPESPLRAVLQDALDVRALLPLARLQRRLRTLRLLDAAEKTVARVVWESLARGGRSGSRPTLAQACRLVPVRGYDRERDLAAGTLAAQGLDRPAASPILLALEAWGHRPGGYAPKADIPLPPEMPAGEAARAILAHLGRVMGENEDGLRRDLDTEFLHDFRVAVRRGRSLLTLLKDVFEPGELAALKAGLQAAGRATTALRDLDVYLLQQPRYQDMLPERLQPGIAPLFAELRRRRRRERCRILAYLASEAYRELRGRLEGGGPDRPPPEAARAPVKPLADRVIFKRFRRVLKTGRRIDGASPDSDLHRLRIEGKKLRYALEFFTSLYPAEEIKDLIRHLKSLQDHLGRLNDLAVQQHFLQSFLEALDAGQPGALPLAAAAGALIGRLHGEHGRRRQDFTEVFAAFQAPDLGARYRRLFSGKEEAA